DVGDLAHGEHLGIAREQFLDLGLFHGWLALRHERQERCQRRRGSTATTGSIANVANVKITISSYEAVRSFRRTAKPGVGHWARQRTQRGAAQWPYRLRALPARCRHSRRRAVGVRYARHATA